MGENTTSILVHLLGIAYDHSSNKHPHNERLSHRLYLAFVSCKPWDAVAAEMRNKDSLPGALGSSLNCHAPHKPSPSSKPLTLRLRRMTCIPDDPLVSLTLSTYLTYLASTSLKPIATSYYTKS